jgi:hypothetical protein
MAASKEEASTSKNKPIKNSSIVTEFIVDTAASCLLREYSKQPNRESSHTGGKSAQVGASEEDKSIHTKLCGVTHTLLPGLRTMISKSELNRWMNTSAFTNELKKRINLFSNQLNSSLPQMTYRVSHLRQPQKYQAVLEKIRTEYPEIHIDLKYGANATFYPQESIYGDALSFLSEELTAEDKENFIDSHHHKRQAKIHNLSCNIEKYNLSAHIESFLSRPLIEIQNKLLLAALRIHLSKTIEEDKLVEQVEHFNSEDFICSFIPMMSEMLDHYLGKFTFLCRVSFFNLIAPGVAIYNSETKKSHHVPHTIHRVLTILSTEDQSIEDKCASARQGLLDSAHLGGDNAWLYYELIRILDNINKTFTAKDSLEKEDNSRIDIGAPSTSQGYRQR